MKVLIFLIYARISSILKFPKCFSIYSEVKFSKIAWKISIGNVRFKAFALALKSFNVLLNNLGKLNIISVILFEVIFLKEDIIFLIVLVILVLFKEAINLSNSTKGFFFSIISSCIMAGNE